MINRKIGKKTKNEFVIGVDGGGTKTACALADLDGKIIKRAVSGGSSVLRYGVKIAAKNIANGIYNVIKAKRSMEIASTVIGLPDIEEEFKDAPPAIIAELKKNKKIAKIFKGKVNIVSDQLVAFRAGANGRDGVVAIAGTGTATHGWNGGNEALVNNQGWVDTGGSEWVGKRVMDAIARSLDGRGEKTALTDKIFKKYKFKDINKLLRFVFQDSRPELAKLSVLCDEAATVGDKVAREILVTAGKEIALSVCVVAKRLGFFEQVPLVLAGGVYKSRGVADTAMNEIERYYPKKFDFVVVGDPVIGAVKLALAGAKLKLRNAK